MSISFSIPKAAVATSVGEDTIRAAIKDGELVAHYIGVKAVVLSTDLAEWIASLPTEKRVS